MHLRKQTFRHISSLLLLAMYVSFLCFQVSYNLGVAHSRLQQRKLLVATQPEKTTVFGSNDPEKNRPEALAKVKHAPSKRFYQKTISVATATISVPPVYFVSNDFVQPTVPFVITSFLRSYSLRGPPAFV